MRIMYRQDEVAQLRGMLSASLREVEDVRKEMYERVQERDALHQQVEFYKRKLHDGDELHTIGTALGRAASGGGGL